MGRLRRGNRAVGAQDDDRATYAEFEKSHRSHFETLQYKQRVKKDLEEDLHLLSDGLNEAEGHRERTMAELELQESNRLQLQKELDSHIEKVQRVNRQITRLEREISSKHGEDSEFYKTDIRLKTLRDISRAVLRTMSKLRETHPEMAYQIDQTIMNVGLRLPTPSPSQSPANSARSIRSSASSKSNLPIGSARTQRSDIQAQPIKQVELGLGAELPSPPGSMTSRSVQSSASSKKSTKSNRS